MYKEIPYQLYERFGSYYDLHTPAHHYQHDHDFVISHILQFGRKGRVLDIGCGTGIFLQKALITGLDPTGIEPAMPLLEKARSRVGDIRVRADRMQDFQFESEFDSIVSLSWSLNYCSDVAELHEVLTRSFAALRPGGGFIAQIAHAPNASKDPPEFNQDCEIGPGGIEDILFNYRFWALSKDALAAEYSFECKSTGDEFREIHKLNCADADLVARILRKVGFVATVILDDYKATPLKSSISPFVLARRPETTNHSLTY